MGLTNSPDVFQLFMHPLFQDMPEVEYFIDDIGLFSSDSFDHHLSLLSQVCLRLEERGFTINPLKCAWCVQSTDFLGFVLTTDGIKPLPEKLRQLVELTALRPLQTYNPS